MNRLSDDIKFEHKSIQTMRGTEKRSIAKAQLDGWELVDQVQGTLRTSLKFRRVKPENFLSKTLKAFRRLAPVKQRALAATVASLLVLLAVVIGVATARGQNEITVENVAAESTKRANVVPASTDPMQSSDPSPSEKPDLIITAKNNEELAALLKVGDNCSPSMSQFAAKYQDQTIEFAGSITNMQKHENYNTRYDILIGPGDQGVNAASGPAFKFQDVNLSDLHLTGKDIRPYVSEGDKFQFTAKVGAFNPQQCLFFLTPISTTPR